MKAGHRASWRFEKFRAGAIRLLVALGAAWPVGAVAPAGADCGTVERIGTFESSLERSAISVIRVDGALIWRSGATVNVDGSPNAYSPDNTGIDFICNAGAPIVDGKVAYAEDSESSRRCNEMYRQARTEGFRGPTTFQWWGIVTRDGVPVTQGPADPAPGKYVSTTRLQDERLPATAPARYVDSETVAFVTVPRDMYRDVVPLKLGDLSIVVDPSTDAVVAAIVADTGPKGHVGEFSVALLRALGHEPVSRGGRANISLRRPVVQVIFGGSRLSPPWPQSNAAIGEAARARFDDWGGRTRLDACLGQL